MSLNEKMREKLEAAFHPTVLEIEDQSEAHRGHAGYSEGGESHWEVRIAAPGFADLSRIGRHRAVHEALGKEIINRIHALSIKIGD